MSSERCIGDYVAKNTVAVSWGDSRIPMNFWLRISPEPNTGCWLRLGSSCARAKTRRRAFNKLVGVVPDGLYIEPLCGSHCVNPTHVVFRKPQPRSVNDRRKRHRMDPKVRAAHYMKSKYGLTPEDYERLLVECSNCCTICKTPFEPFGAEQHQRPHIDHCHKSNRIRGLLCMGCNTGIGVFRESTDRLTAAIAYLAKHEASR